ncbi:shikimate kinase [Staphylococcus aureus]|nr:shikimate kinase [Staphylococcus aureus]
MNHDKSPIILIGFMGTGKSTIGKYVADEQNLSFIDIDSYIEEKYKLTIPEIFSKHGEQYFRNLEFTCLQECINTADLIATGGGSIESEEAFNFLKNQKNIIWLDCNIDIIYSRINDDPHRPNANNKTITQLNDLYCSRILRYNEIAFKKFDSHLLSISEIYYELLNLIKASDQY